jgi:hypothetical protein
LTSKNYNWKKIIFKTAGSTGNRLSFYGDDSMYKKESAYIQHSFKSHNSVLYDEWTIWIRRHSPKNIDDLVTMYTYISMILSYESDMIQYLYHNTIDYSERSHMILFNSIWLFKLLLIIIIWKKVLKNDTS